MDKESINRLPQHWQSNQDPHFIMQEISEFVLKFVQHRLSSDMELIHDFYVDFYEGIAESMATHSEYKDMPFWAFLPAHIHFKFMNFVRKKRRRELAMLNLDQIVPPASRAELDLDGLRSASDDQRHRLSRELDRIELKLRLPTKLYYGLELGLDELQSLLSHSEKSSQASAFLTNYRHRRHKRLKQLHSIQNRIRYLNYNLDCIADTNAEQRDAAKRYRKWKQRLLGVLETHKGIYTMEELARLLQVNRSSIMRRINKARQILAGKLGAEKQWTINHRIA